jgi:hypothetical protein
MDFCVHVVDAKSIIIVTSNFVKDLTKMFPRDFLYCMCLVKTWLTSSLLAFI